MIPTKFSTYYTRLFFPPLFFLSEILVPYKKVSMIKKEKWKIWKKHVKKKQILEHDDIVITTNKNWAVNKQQHVTAFLKKQTNKSSEKLSHKFCFFLSNIIHQEKEKL